MPGNNLKFLRAPGFYVVVGLVLLVALLSFAWGWCLSRGEPATAPATQRHPVYSRVRPVWVVWGLLILVWGIVFKVEKTRESGPNAVIAARDLPAGLRLADADAAPTTMPIPSSNVISPKTKAAWVGKVTTAPVARGTVLVESMFMDVDAASTSVVSVAHGWPAPPLPGDKVIILAVKPPATQPTVLSSNAVVIAADGVRASIAVTPNEAADIIVAQTTKDASVIVIRQLSH